MTRYNQKNRTNIRARRTGAFRLSVLALIAAALLTALLARLAHMQLRDGGEYAFQSEKNSFKNIPMPAVRAPIVDRNGVTMAYDAPGYSLVTLKRNGLWDSRRVTFKEASEIEEKGAGAGSYVQANPMRTYPHGAVAAHVTGYVGEISPEDLQRFRHKGYRAGDRVGKSGLERQYELKITGTKGRRKLRVDSKGRFLRAAEKEEALGGEPFVCAIDMRLQKEAYEALIERGRPGAALVMKAQTGEVLVMATNPSFDANLSTGGFSPEVWSSLHKDPSHPMMNRAVSVAAPLGSVFKLVTAAAALNEHILTPANTFTCRGAFRLGSHSFKCWKGGGHGTLSMVQAIAQSCNVYFFNAGRQAGVTNLHKYAKMLGLGSRTGIDVPGEAIGLIPDPVWKQMFRRVAWLEGETINMSIGQGYVQVSPVQALVLANVYATRGRLVAPRLYLDGKTKSERVNELSPETIEIVRQGMRAAVDGGTAARFRQLSATSAGKTGTAQDPPRPMSHAWFVGFAPYENPELVYAVFVENAGGGSAEALPVALRVLKLAEQLGYLGEPPPAPEPGPAISGRGDD